MYCSLTPKGLSPAALSPALQRLVNRSSSKYTDKALRASYTPSPAHGGMGSKTPLGGSATSSNTPTPGKTRTPATQDPASITDDLLQLPKRRKAVDYFWTYRLNKNSNMGWVKYLLFFFYCIFYFYFLKTETQLIIFFLDLIL